MEWTSKVIDRAEYISDSNVMIKAFLRRGLAYEQLEKFLQAKEDMLSVKQLQASNKTASECLNRCNRAIKAIYGDAVPEAKKNAPVKLAAAAEGAANSTPKAAETKSEPEKPKMTVQELSKRLVEYKDLGNNQFKQKQYPVAASIFTGGVDFFLANEAQCRSDTDCMVKVAQLYTNRSLAYFNNNEQEPAFKDADYVLTHIDHRNAKALFRRA